MEARRCVRWRLRAVCVRAGLRGRRSPPFDQFHGAIEAVEQFRVEFLDAPRDLARAGAAPGAGPERRRAERKREHGADRGDDAERGALAQRRGAVEKSGDQQEDGARGNRPGTAQDQAGRDEAAQQSIDALEQRAHVPTE